MKGLPIVSYHGIESKEGEYSWLEAERVYIVSLQKFRTQLDQLSQEGFTTLSLNELDEWLDGKSTLGKPSVLTFDDGHVSHFEYVVPLLKQKQFKAIFFVPVSLVGQKEHMDWAQLKEIIQEGFEIGSHGFRHIPLSNLTHHELWKELQKSKMILEDRLGVAVKSFSVPRGYYQLRIREFAMEMGYRFIFTSRFDINFKGQDPWRLNRLAVKRDISLNHFSRMVSGNLGYKRLLEGAKENARRFVKPSIYDALANLKRAVLQRSRG